MSYAFSKKSLSYAQNVHPVMMQVATLALSISDQDFGFTEAQGRTIEQQRQKVKEGVSKTLESNHLIVPDLSLKTKIPYVHAIDAVPWDGKAFVWEWPRVYHVASAFARAAKQLGVAGQMCWGGVWDKWLAEYIGDCTPATMEKAQQAYNVRHPGKDFPDGPHMQIYRKG